jgi:DNA-binding beta-propeller fold protein YncE
MELSRSAFMRSLLLLSLMASLTVLSTRLQADTGSCGGVTTTLPFTDVQGNPFFCLIAEAYFSGLTAGTSATTYSPSQNVTREQMAAFITRTMDQSLKRGSRRAALDQFWTTASSNSLALTMVEDGPIGVKSDGADIWVANLISDTVSRVRASDGRVLETWSGATDAYSVLCAMGKVFVTGAASTGRLYQIDPTQPAGMVTTLSNDLGGYPRGIAFDGQRIWTANTSDGSLSIITLNPTSVTNVATGFTSLRGILYDGANIWVTEYVSVGVGKLHKLDANGATLQSVDVGGDPRHMAFDGINLWVPNVGSGTVSVVRATGSLSGTVIATLSGNGLAGPIQAAFDGERVLVTNLSGNSVSLWKATDLAPLGSVSTGSGTDPFGACSDGVNFWVTLYGTDRLARF